MNLRGTGNAFLVKESCLKGFCHYVIGFMLMSHEDKVGVTARRSYGCHMVVLANRPDLHPDCCEGCAHLYEL